MTLSALNWLDYILIAIILLSMVISFFRGFVREAISLATWLVGIIVALKYASLLQIHFQAWISSPTLRFALAFLALFLLVLIIGIFVNIGFHAMVRRVGLKVFDRILGVVFGVARGVLVAALILMFMGAGTEHSTSSVQQSQLAPHFNPLVNWLRLFLPDKMKLVSDWVSQTETQMGQAEKEAAPAVESNNPVVSEQ